MSWGDLFGHSKPKLEAAQTLLGRELFWWRHRNGLWTRVTFLFPDLQVPDRFHLKLRLYDERGKERQSWCQAVCGGEPFAIDSKKMASEVDLSGEGLLCIETHADSGNGQPSLEARQRFVRLYGYIDWLSEEGEVAGLHSDQVVGQRARPLGLTEVVLTDLGAQRHALVYLIGDDEQPRGTVHFRAQAKSQPPLSVTLPRALSARRAHVLWLDEIFGKAWLRMGDGPVLLSGHIDTPRHYTRPYVLSVGARTSAYHGGDRYEMPTLPQFKYTTLGEGEMNPALVVENNELSTTVNLLNSHGMLDSDFSVGIRLYATDGQLVTHERHFGMALRNDLARHGFSALVPSRPFVGYAAFTFSDRGRHEYPGHLQALMEYRARDSVVRMMFWSDQWNTLERRRHRERLAVPYQAYGRLLDTEEHEVWWAITNCGDSAYADDAEATLEVKACEGWSASAVIRLRPHETLFAPLGDLVPSAADRLVGATGACLVTTTSDLAMAQLIRHRKSGVWAGEHVMSIIEHVGDASLAMAGS